MPSYAEGRRVLSRRISGAQTNNTDVGRVLIPAGTEINVLAMKGFVGTAAGASTSLKFVDASDVVLAEISTVSTGAVADVTASRFPFAYTNSTASDVVLKLRINGTWGASSDMDVEVHMTEPGHK